MQLHAKFLATQCQAMDVSYYLSTFSFMYISCLHFSFVKICHAQSSLHCQYIVVSQLYSCLLSVQSGCFDALHSADLTAACRATWPLVSCHAAITEEIIGGSHLPGSGPTGSDSDSGILYLAFGFVSFGIIYIYGFVPFRIAYIYIIYIYHIYISYWLYARSYIFIDLVSSIALSM